MVFLFVIISLCMSIVTNAAEVKELSENNYINIEHTINTKVARVFYVVPCKPMLSCKDSASYAKKIQLIGYDADENLIATASKVLNPESFVCEIADFKGKITHEKAEEFFYLLLSKFVIA